MKSWEDALAEVLNLVAPLPAQRAPLREARGRFLQESIVAESDAPTCNLSTMDGYAVGPEASVGAELRVRVTSRAGDPPGGGIRSGEAARIFTGAPVPDGASRVVPQEEVESLSDRRILLRKIPDASFIRPRGSEARAGDVILSRAQRLGPAELGILATLGHCNPLVGGRPRVAHLALGTELVDPGCSPACGQIRDSNSILIRSLLHENGAEPVFHRRLADDPEAIRSAINASASISDMLLISGGASVGDHDHSRSCLREMGYDFAFEGLHLRPGKPSAVAFRENHIAICLPGNPVAHLAVFQLMVRPILENLAGATNSWPVFYHAPLLESLPGRSNSRHTFWPAVHGPDGLHLLRFLSSGDSLALAGVNAMISLVPGTALPHVGSSVPFLPLHSP